MYTDSGCRSEATQDNALVETWNERVAQGPPVGAFPEFDGWSMGHAMPLARSEHAVAQLGDQIWVLGGYPPGRLPSNLVQIYDPATSRWSLGPRLPQPIHHMMVKAVDGRLYVIGGEIDGASTGRPEIWTADVEGGTVEPGAGLFNSSKTASMTSLIAPSCSSGSS